MTATKMNAKNYPIAEKNPDLVIGKREKKLNSLTIEDAVDGKILMEDFEITPTALLNQAKIAESVGRLALARNFKRAAEMTRLPKNKIMKIYELLRPGRTNDKTVLVEISNDLRKNYEAPILADFILEAANSYEKRGLYKKRY